MPDKPAPMQRVGPRDLNATAVENNESYGPAAGMGENVPTMLVNGAPHDPNSNVQQVLEVDPRIYVPSKRGK